MAVKKKKVKAAADQVDKQQNGVSEQKAADGDGKHKQAAAQVHFSSKVLRFR